MLAIESLLCKHVCWGGFQEEGAEMMASYQGGKKDCIWVKKNMTVLAVMMLVEAAMGEALRGRVMWFSLNMIGGS